MFLISFRFAMKFTVCEADLESVLASYFFLTANWTAGHKHQGFVMLSVCCRQSCNRLQAKQAINTHDWPVNYVVVVRIPQPTAHANAA